MKKFSEHSGGIQLAQILGIMTLFFGGGNVSHVGHLGGVLVGWLYMRRQGDTGSLFSFDQLKYRWTRTPCPRAGRGRSR